MTEQLTTTRASRNRRIIAVAAWTALVMTAGVLWNGRQLGHIRSVAAEPVAFLLAAFAAFVSVFAWMLFNPNQRSAAESPTLFLAGTVTLFPPCIIGFCLLPPDSPLRGWLAVGLLVLVVIAVLSPVPEEFFAIPRARSSYFQPTPELQLSDDWVLVRETNWLQDPDVAKVVSSQARSSLAPSAYRGRVDERDPVRLPRSERIAQRRRQRAERKAAETDPEKDAAPAAEAAARRERLKGAEPRPRTGNDPSPKIAPTESSVAVQQAPVKSPQAAAPAQNIETGLPPGTSAEIETVHHAAHDTLAAPKYERFKDEFGTELVEGTVTVRFEPGQKRANLHIPFAPPLAGAPEVECEAVGDLPLRLKIPVRQSYGLRIEARRTDAEAAAETEIGFAAVYSPR